MSSRLASGDGDGLRLPLTYSCSSTPPDGPRCGLIGVDRMFFNSLSALCRLPESTTSCNVQTRSLPSNVPVNRAIVRHLLELTNQIGPVPETLDAERDLVPGALGDALQLELLLGERQHLVVGEQREQVRVLVQSQTLEPRRYI